MKAYKKFNCDMKNEAECEEELEDEGLSLDEAENEFFKEAEDVPIEDE